MRRALALFIICISILQCVPFSTALTETSSKASNVASGNTPAVDPSDLSPSGALLNDMWLKSPRTTGVPLSYDDVMLVINDASQLSKDIGNYFLAHRPIPQANICNFTTSTSEHINQNTFDTSVRPGVEACLNKNGLKDKINFIVTTKGFPLGISGLASVDSELSLILGPYNGSIGGSGRIKNPYFDKDEPFSHAKFGTYLVTRLTAYDLNDVKHLIDLADNSTGKRGTFLLDEGAKGGGYQSGDIWINDANTTLVNKGFNTSHDKSGTFQMNYKNLSGYASWGSNDGNYWSSYGQNTGFETDSNADGIPDNWVVEKDGATTTRTSATAQSGTYSFQIVRGSQTSSESIIGQNLTIAANTRYWLTGTANLSAISNPGGGAGAHLFIRAYNSANKIVATFNSSSYTGNQNWFWTNQIHYEPTAGVTKIMIGGAVFKSSGTAYFDEVSLHIIKPNNTYVPGAIGETYVSTGGRSFMYGTDYGQSLVVDLLREGISGVSGHVYEPYLDACGHPDILFDRYTSAYSMAESFWNALYYLSWMEVVAGDPKMDPYWNIPDPLVDSTNITVTPSDPAVGENVTITARIFDKSEGVSNLDVHFYTGVPNPGNKLGPTIVIPILGRGQEYLATLKYTFTEVKATTISVVVDPLNKIRELDENNNKGSITFDVGYRPDLAISAPDIKVSKTDILQGDLVGLNIIAANIGGVSTNLTGTANLTLPDGTVLTTYPLHLDPILGGTNGTVLTTIINTSTILGDACVNVTLRSSRLEDNLTNNIASACVFVKHLDFSLEQHTFALVVPPLTFVEHNFTLINLANIDDKFTITHQDSNTLWGVDVNPSSIELRSNARVIVKVQTLSTATLVLGDKLWVNVTVTAASSGQSKVLTFVSTTGPTYEVAFSMSETGFEGLPGSKVQMELTIGNLGNAVDNITVKATGPAGWLVHIGDVTTTLAVGQYNQVTADVTIPLSTLAGTIGEIEYTAFSEKGSSNVSVKAYVTVNQVYNLRLITPTMTVPAGKTVTGLLGLTNLGNGIDKFHLEATAPSFLVVEFLTNDIELEAGANRSDLGIKVTATKGAPLSGGTVTVKATSESTKSVELEMSVKVIKAELIIKFLSTPDAKVLEGKTVSFKVEVRTLGEVPVNATDISFSVGAKVQTRQITFSSGTNVSEQTFDLNCKAGTWNIALMVDPTDAIAETNETNNKVTFKLTVEHKSVIGGDNGSLLPIWAVIVVIVLVCVGYLGAKTFIWSRRLKAAAKSGEEKRMAQKLQTSEAYEKPLPPKVDKPKPIAPKEEAPKPEQPKKEPLVPVKKDTPQEPPKTEEPKTVIKEEAPPEVTPGPPAEAPTPAPEPKPEPKPEPAPPQEKPAGERSQIDDLLDLLNKS
jgi:uncharacterized protein (TIGR03790 family)